MPSLEKLQPSTEQQQQAQQITQQALAWLNTNPDFLKALAQRWSEPTAKQFGPITFSTRDAIFTATHDSTARHESTSTLNYQQIFCLRRQNPDGTEDLLEIGTGTNPFVHFNSTRLRESKDQLTHAQTFLRNL